MRARGGRTPTAALCASMVSSVARWHRRRRSWEPWAGSLCTRHLPHALPHPRWARPRHALPRRTKPGKARLRPRDPPSARSRRREPTPQPRCHPQLRSWVNRGGALERRRWCAALEHVIRHIALLAHTVDNNTSTGPAYHAFFPNGLNPEVRPTGTVQVTVSTTLRERLASQRCGDAAVAIAG